MNHPPDLRRCGACYQPQTGHGTRYAAGIGNHDWTPDPWRPPGSRPAPEHWATTAIPHPAGGVTYPRSPEEYQRYLEDTAPAEPPEAPTGGADTIRTSIQLPADWQGRMVLITADRHLSFEPKQPWWRRWWRRLLGTTEGTI